MLVQVQGSIPPWPLAQHPPQSTAKVIGCRRKWCGGKSRKTCNTWTSFLWSFLPHLGFDWIPINSTSIGRAGWLGDDSSTFIEVNMAK